MTPVRQPRESCCAMTAGRSNQRGGLTMLGNAHTVAPSPAMVSRDIAKGPIDGQICRSGYLGGRNRLGCSGANPCESVLQSGFFIGAHPTRTSCDNSAPILAAGERRVAVRDRSQIARCKSERIRRLAAHRSRGQTRVAGCIDVPARGEKPASHPSVGRGPFGEKTRRQHG